MKLKNEQGVTLLEVLAVLVLVSMVATIIMTTFFIANRHNLTETKKLKMQQDANYIITTILQKHRTSERCYDLKLNDEEKLVFIDCESTTQEDIIGHEYTYNLVNIEVGNNPHDPLLSSGDTVEVYPKEENLKAKLIVTHPQNEKLTVSIDTTFKRYKSESK